MNKKFLSTLTFALLAFSVMAGNDSPPVGNPKPTLEELQTALVVLNNLKADYKENQLEFAKYNNAAELLAKKINIVKAENAKIDLATKDIITGTWMLASGDKRIFNNGKCKAGTGIEGMPGWDGTYRFLSETDLIIYPTGIGGSLPEKYKLSKDKKSLVRDNGQIWKKQ